MPSGNGMFSKANCRIDRKVIAEPGFHLPSFSASCARGTKMLGPLHRESRKFLPCKIKLCHKDLISQALRSPVTQTDHSRCKGCLLVPVQGVARLDPEHGRTSCNRHAVHFPQRHGSRGTVQQRQGVRNQGGSVGVFC